MAKFKPGDPKPPNSGRAKGVKNKKTVLRAEDVMAEKDFNPTETMIALLLDAETPTDLKVKLAIALNALINPPAKAIESEPPADPLDNDNTPNDEASLLQLLP